ncbi:LOW QUALITY PROTEIN: nucleolar protein 14 [Microcaecilia unicolor]|uniref:LOW QUALITY PROTEIN: nucleolar protein 14 n=1 Tax=Microcaecilia unicolor TaxID=1415580 RepID=A0A6P7XA46_9AMPH|nr:LOW QUALITY PROTEIN: nucleolar protein 14 [Microcaecilia unicolor]
MGRLQGSRRRGASTGIPEAIRSNPFEVKVNRQKFHVLGKKRKHEVGLPGVSRSRAVRKRTATLLKEYRQRGKSSVFIDKRFGEYDTKISPEEKMMKRFALERQRNTDKKSIYNLNEDEELTHYGQSLADIEKLNDIVDSDSDAEERGALSAELTAAHFGGGGGLLHKKDASAQKEEVPEKAKSRKELIEELIAKSKQEKRERQTQKEQTLELTEKLDSDWKQIQGLLAHKTPTSKRKDNTEFKTKPDEYDMIVRELGFEIKVQPSDRMKTEDELAKEEQERLQQLEAERLHRMLGDNEGNKNRPKHTSADDLGDGFVLDKDDRQLLSYKDGKLLNLGDEQGDNENENESVMEEGGDETSCEDEENETSDDDSHSDLESDLDSQEVDGIPENKEAVKTKPKKKLLRREEAQFEPVGTELPYTFTAPESYEDLQHLLSGKSGEQQLIVLERIQKCNHPSLAVGNKAKLEKLFGFLLEYSGELATRDPPELKMVDKLVLHLYNLCQMFPEAAGGCVRSILRDAAHEMEEMIEVKGRAALPRLDVLVILKITSILFPTSDFWHPVVTPALSYMSQVLIKCPVVSLEDVTTGLFVCCLFLEYVSLSRRFIPELINFLLGILHLSVPSTGIVGYTLVHPFRLHGKNSELLLVSNKEDIETWHKKYLPLYAVNGLTETSKTELNHYRLSCLATCLDLVKKSISLYGSLPAFQEIIGPIRTLLTDHLPVKEYPKQLQELVKNVLEEMDSKEKHYEPLVFEKKKPVPLKLYTPKVVEILDFGRKQGCSREERERKRLIHKHKREFKGAIREIRKDSQFLAKQQLSEIMERDRERKRKVNQLFNSLSTQEGEWKALKRKKMKGESTN